LLASARQRGRPIAAIVNTHWHLDHTGGNAEVRAAYPKAPVYGSKALEGALTGFFPQSRKSAEEFLPSGQASVGLEAEIRRDFAAMDGIASLRATRADQALGTPGADPVKAPRSLHAPLSAPPPGARSAP
jgi:glyoxylase-like metal-dependent hydrolase (beta-lactamase superfamily II)